jgi:hypothetical protein
LNALDRPFALLVLSAGALPVVFVFDPIEGRSVSPKDDRMTRSVSLGAFKKLIRDGEPAK